MTDDETMGAGGRAGAGWDAAALDRLAGALTPDQADALTRRLLARTRRIAHIWAVPDVLDCHPGLTAEQAWEVLCYVDGHLSAELGVTWDTLEDAAWHLFGEPAGAGDEDEDAEEGSGD